MIDIATEMTKYEKNKLKYQAHKAVEEAWEREFERALKGLQTRVWTDEEFELLKNKKKVPGYEGHHMKSVKAYPEYAGDPDNIQFLKQIREDGQTKDGDHFKAHGGNFRNPTNGYYDEKTETTIPFEDGERPSILKYERTRYNEEKQAGTEGGVFFMSKNENKGGSKMGNLALCTPEGIGMLTEAASLMENMGINCGPLVEGLQAAQIAAEGMSIAQAALNLVMSLNPIALVTIAIASLVAGLIYLWNTNEDFKNALIGAWNMISEVCSAVWDAIVLFFTETLPGVLETAVNFFAELPGKIWEFLSQAVDKLGEWASGLISKAGEVLPGVISSVVGFFSGLPGKMLEVGKNLVQGIWNGISNAAKWVLEKIKGFGATIVNGIKNIFGIHSPSTIMRDEIGKNLALGVAEGITKNTDAVSDAMSEIADVVADSDISVEPEVKATSIDFEAFKEKIRPSLDFVKSQISRAQDVLNTQFAASLQLAGAMAGANNTYNNGNTFNNHYTITASNNSPKATADAIKNQMTMQRMLFATR